LERLRDDVLGAQLRVGVAEACLDRVAVEEQPGVLDAGLFQRGLDPAEHRLLGLDRGLAARELDRGRLAEEVRQRVQQAEGQRYRDDRVLPDRIAVHAKAWSVRAFARLKLP